MGVGETGRCEVEKNREEDFLKALRGRKMSKDSNCKHSLVCLKCGQTFLLVETGNVEEIRNHMHSDSNNYPTEEMVPPLTDNCRVCGWGFVGNTCEKCGSARPGTNGKPKTPAVTSAAERFSLLELDSPAKP